MPVKDRAGKVLWDGSATPENDELLALCSGVEAEFWDSLGNCYVHYRGDHWVWHLGPGLMPPGPHCGGCGR